MKKVVGAVFLTGAILIMASGSADTLAQGKKAGKGIPRRSISTSRLGPPGAFGLSSG
jgi:hypothetical protein